VLVAVVDSANVTCWPNDGDAVPEVVDARPLVGITRLMVEPPPPLAQAGSATIITTATTRDTAIHVLRMAFLLSVRLREADRRSVATFLVVTSVEPPEEWRDPERR
jgi:hypothetical protein